jgi:hypothetical protein
MGRAACAHALENRYRKAVWGSNYRVDYAVPEGSNPLSDQYYSSNNLEILLDGAAYRRIDKVVFLAKHPWSVKDIHVCFNDLSSTNCGRCSKCVRSKVAFELAGLSATCKSLEPVTAELIRSTYCGDSAEQVFFGEMLDYARQIGRSDMADALSGSLRRSRCLRPLMDFANWLHTKPGVWRFGREIRRAIVS